VKKRQSQIAKTHFGVFSHFGDFSWRFFTLCRFLLAFKKKTKTMNCQEKSPKCEETPRKNAKV